MRQFVLMTDQAQRQHRSDQATLAWSIAKLSRADKIPSLEDLLPRPPRSREEAAAEMQAAMQAYRDVAAARGQIRSWDEWLH